MDPIFLTDGIEVPSVMEEKKPLSFSFLLGALSVTASTTFTRVLSSPC
jgi:hypothetical protein